MSRTLFAVTLVGSVIVFASSCAEPPTKEFHQAEDAIAAARLADAATYAADELQVAEATLQKYDAAVAQRDYRQALNLAQEARDRAYAAEKLAATGKTAARALAEKLAADRDALITSGNARLAGTAGPRPTGQAAERLRAALAAAGNSVQETRAMLERHDYRGATLRLTPLVQALQKELTPIEPAAGRRGRSSTR